MISLLVVGVWLMGAIALQDFALALLVGLLAGSYSSIFIATPILAMLKGREARYRPSTRKRPVATTTPAAARSAASTSPALDATPTAETEDVVVSGRALEQPAPPPPATLTHAPRPRKKRRR